MKTFSLRILLCLLVWLPAVWAAPGDEFFDASLGDYAAELKAAREQGKRGAASCSCSKRKAVLSANACASKS